MKEPASGRKVLAVFTIKNSNFFSKDNLGRLKENDLFFFNFNKNNK